MSAWRKEPPTYQEWSSINNHGRWWVKFILIPKELDEMLCQWPEVWYTDVVTINVSYEKGRLLDPDAARLHAEGTILGLFDLDDPEQTKGMYWQPVCPPLDDK
jgi:hypothetical protein